MNGITVRRARAEDVGAIAALINAHTADGALLPRTTESVAARLRDFVTARHDDVVIGCAALERMDSELAEVRSVVVDAAYRGSGIGAELVTAVLRLAQRAAVRRVFCLTRRVSFFARLGFAVVDPRGVAQHFPQKVWRDCAVCPRRFACDETAMERVVAQASSRAWLHRARSAGTPLAHQR